MWCTVVREHDMNPLQDLPRAISAIGGLGTAAFGVVDATKVFGGGVNHIGFRRIRGVAARLAPETPLRKMILDTLQANWINGIHLADQKAIAKSLIKLNLSAANAHALAEATGMDSDALAAVAKNISSGTPLSSAQSDVFARFELIVTALLDEAYQRSDQVYRNWTRALAALVAITIALAGGVILRIDLGVALLAGFLAVPLAPIAKDVSTSLATAVNRLQRTL